MSKAVSASKGQTDSTIDTARRAWQEARYDEAVSLLNGRQDVESRLLLGRTLLRQRRYDLVDGALRGGQYESPESRTAALIMTTSAAERLRMDKEPASIAVPPSSSRALRGSVHLHEAQTAFRSGDSDAAMTNALMAFKLGDERTRVSALDMQAWIENSRESPLASVPLFREVIRLLENSAIRDEHMRANALQGLSFVAVSTLDTGLLKTVEESLSTLVMTPWIARAYTATSISVATLHGLLGTATKEYQCLLRAREAQASSKVLGLSDVHIAEFHRRRGGNDVARLHLDLAFEDLQGIDWANSDVEQRSVGILFASEAALIGDKRAGSAFTRAVSTTGKRDPMLVFEHDERVGALALLARARIAESREEYDDALRDARRALEVSTKLGDRLGAVSAEIDILRMSGDTEASRSLTQTAKMFPHSWIKTEIDRLNKIASSPRLLLTEAEERVLLGICEGLTSRQIAQSLGRSPATIRVQTVNIFRKYEVSTRTALAAKVKEHG